VVCPQVPSVTRSSICSVIGSMRTRVLAVVTQTLPAPTAISSGGSGIAILSARNVSGSTR
jgi:hypothetical protein